MFRGHRHESGPEDGVRPGGEDGQLAVVALDGKIDLGPDALADPVALHGQHLLRPARQLVTEVEQFLGVGGDFEEPAVHLPRLTRLSQRQQAPSITCSLASTVWQVSHQLTVVTFW